MAVSYIDMGFILVLGRRPYPYAVWDRTVANSSVAMLSLTAPASRAGIEGCFRRKYEVLDVAI